MSSRLILGCGNFGGVGSAPRFFGRGESEEEAYRLLPFYVAERTTIARVSEVQIP